MAGVTRRGVYLDLSKSPYEYLTPYGDLLKFSSAKKLEIYRREIPNELKRLERLLERNELIDQLYETTLKDLTQGIYMALYRAVER